MHTSGWRSKAAFKHLKDNKTDREVILYALAGIMIFTAETADLLEQLIKQEQKHENRE